MSKSINISNGYSLPKVDINKENVQETIAKSSQVVSDSFESNSAVKTISSTAGDGGFSQAAPLVPLLYVVDKFVDGAMSGDIEKNILGKTAKFGDKLYESLNLGRFISDAKINSAKEAISRNRFTKYFTDTYKANPICSMAKPESLAKKIVPQVDNQAQKFVSKLVNALYDPSVSLDSVSAQTRNLIENAAPLNQRLTGEYLSKFSRALDELSDVAISHGSDPQSMSSSVTSLKKSITNFASGTGKVSEVGLSKQIASFLSNFSGGKFNGQAVSLSDDAVSLLSSVGNKQFSTKDILAAADDLIANGVKIDGKDLSIARNKLAAANSQVGKTTLGKVLSKGVVKTKDIATYGGGLISLFFMASSIMNAVKATKEAPKGEKKATFMHVLSEQYLGMVLFQPSISLLYKVAGNKYRGMSEGGRKALTELIAKTNVDETLTKEGLKVAKMQRKLLLKGVDQTKVANLAGKTLKEAKQIAKSLNKEGAKLKFWEKPLKAFGSVLALGLDKMKIPKFLNIAGKKIKIPQPTFKGFVGGFGRLLLIMLVIQPLLQKPLTKLTHKIFGEPKSYLEKQKAKENNSNNENKANAQNANVQNSPNVDASDRLNISQFSDTNLLKKLTQDKTSGSQIAAAPISDQYKNNNVQSNPNAEIPAFSLFNRKKDDRYIPEVKPFIPADNSKELEAKAQEILKKTDKVMQETLKYV